MVDESIVGAVQAYMRALQAQGLDVKFGVLFGSWVKGRANQWSDIDLLIISPQFDNGRDDHWVNLLWRTAARVDSRIEPIACGERQWNEHDASAIIEIARREGERIDLPIEVTPTPNTSA